MDFNSINNNSSLSSPFFNVRRGSGQSIPASTITKIQFNSETIDSSGFYDSTTNYRFTPLIAGYYYISLNLSYTLISSGKRAWAYIYKNGIAEATGYNNTSIAGDYITSWCAAIIYLNGSTDYVEAYGYQSDSVSRNTTQDDTTIFCGFRLH